MRRRRLGLTLLAIAVATASIAIPALALGQESSTTQTETGIATATDPVTSSTPTSADAPADAAPPLSPPDQPPPAPPQEQQQSESAYADLNNPESRTLLEEKFAEEFTGFEQEAARQLEPSDYEQFFSNTKAVVDVPGSDMPQVLDSLLPLRDRSDDGSVEPIDLGVERDGSDWEAKNPLVDVSLPADAGQQLRLQDTGIGIQLDSPSADQAQAVASDGDKLFYHDAARDTDLMITPISLGAEIFAQVRSADAPERLGFTVDLPEGAELRNAGEAGLEVVRDGTRRSLITNSTAVDSRGTSVPTHLEQTGPESFDIVIDHRTAPDVVYPVLVDPGVESWYWPDDPSTGVWDNRGWSASSWTQNGYSAPYPSSGCQTGINWICWWHGLYVQVGPQWQIAPGAGAEWAYYAPGSTGYITRAVFGAFNFTRGGETGNGPYLYAGVYSPTCTAGGPGSPMGCWPPESEHSLGNPYTNGTVDCGCGPLPYNPPAPNAGYGPTTKVVFGMANNTWRTGSNKMAAHRTAALAGMQIYLRDNDRPSMQAPLANEVPTEWVDSEDLTFTAAASDPSLGVYRTQLILPEPGPGLSQTQTFSKTENCGGSFTTGLCPNSNLDTSAGDAAETDRFTFNTSDLYDGYQEVRLRALDPVGVRDDGSIDVAHAVDRVVPIYVDHSAPAFRDVSGSLAAAAGGELLQPSYDLHVRTRDGWQAVPSSGVKSVEILLDGQRAAYREQACPQDNCSMELNWTLETAGLSPGTHRVQIVTRDQLGHRAVHTLPGIVEPSNDVIKAIAYDGNPSSGGKWLRDEWLVINSNVTKVKTAEDTSVVNRTSCPGDNQDECDQVLSTTNRSNQDPGSDENYSVETGSREEDPQVENPSLVRATVEGSLSPNQGTGSFTAGTSPVLQNWQHLPLGSDGTFKLFQDSQSQEVAPIAVETGADQGPFYLTVAHSTWVDNATGMPVREQTTENGLVVHQRFWDYFAYPSEQVPEGTFELPPRPGTTEFQEVTHHGNEQIASQGESELGASGPTQMRSAVASIDNSDFVPYFLGGQPDIPLTVANQDGPGRVKASVSGSGAGTGQADAPTYQELVGGEDPLLYWRLGDDSGSDASDLSGHARTGAYVGSPTLNAPGAISARTDDGAVDLNGGSQYVSGYQTRRNLLSNPSVEEGTTGFGAWGSTSSFIQDTTVAKHSANSLRVVGAPSGAGVWAGKGTGGWIPVTPGRNYSAAAQLRGGGSGGGGSGGLALYICYVNANYSTWLRCDSRNVNATAGWTRAVVNGSDFGAAPAGAAYGLVFALNASSGTQDFSVDAVQFEPTDVISGYFDGFSAGADWEGAENASSSAQGPFVNGAVRTFEGWAKRRSQNTLDMLLGGTSSDQSAPYLMLGDGGSNPAGRVTWAPAGNTGGNASWDNAWPGTDKWVHWALVFDEPADRAELFINGQSKGALTLSTAYGQAPGKLRVGSWGYAGTTGFGFDGHMDEVAVYDKALTPTKLAQHYDAAVGGYRKQVGSRDPALYWRLGEDSGQAALDSSGHGRAGSYVGSPSLNAEGAVSSGDDGAVDLNGTSQYISSNWVTRRNIVANPSFEADTTGWGYWWCQATLQRSTAQAQSGTASLKVSAPSTCGAVNGVSATAGKTYSAALQLRGGTSAGLQVSLLYVNSSLQLLRNDSFNVNASGGWTRFAYNGSQFGAAPAGTIAIWVTVMNMASTNQDFYVDSAQVEEGSSIGPYFDGSSQDARWEGAANNSTSATDGAFINGTTRTFEGWANRDTDTTDDVLFGGSDPNTDPWLKLNAGSNDVRFKPDESVDASSGITWANAWPGKNQWVHWALVFNEASNQASLYINGELVSTQTTVAPYSPSPGRFIAGARYSLGAITGYFDGKVDDLAVYNRALTPAEIASDHQVSQPAPVDDQLCLNSVDSAYFSDPPRSPDLPPEDPEDGPPDPSGDEEYVAANYQTDGFGGQCTPGLEAPQDPDLDVISAPPDTAMSQAAADQYLPLAENAAPGDPDTGVVTIDVQGDPTPAYVIPIDDQSDSALIPLDNATVIITGDFNKSTIDNVTEGLQPR
jgi:hypothetical protein